ncbi:MAG: Calx-beta domain-containing protein [Synechococcaceae cyanobacterium]
MLALFTPFHYLLIIMPSPSLPTPLDKLLFEAQNLPRGQATVPVPISRAGVMVSLPRPSGAPEKGASAVADVALSLAPGSIRVAALPAASGGIVTSASPLITSESGGNASFQVVLAKQPSDVVFLNISSDKPEGDRANVTQLTFTPVNWDVPQTVVVTGQDDQRVDGPAAYNIVLDPSASAASEYSKLPPISVEATNIDNDLPSLSISSPSDVAVEGRDSSVSFLLTLSEAGRLPVCVTLTTEDGTATAGADYVPSTLKVEIPKGRTQLLVPISLINNNIAEPDESFSVKITSVTNATLLEGQDKATASITDTITNSTRFILPAGVENLRLIGNDAINGTGNIGPNQIVGNDASNVLKGGGGLDTLTGMGGQDSFDLTGIRSSANTQTITDFVTGVEGDRLLLSNSLTSRYGTGTAMMRTITSLSANNLTLETSPMIFDRAFDIFLIDTPINRLGVDLSRSGNGSEMLKGLCSGDDPMRLNTTTTAGRGYIGAYANNNFYLYWFSAGTRDINVSSNEIELIAVLNSIAPGSLVANNFQLV